MSIEGKVMIELGAGGGSPVRVDYHQPVQVGRLLRGKAPQTALQILATVYSVCGNAQCHAATLALEAAQDIGHDAATARSRAVMTALETWRETLLRIVLEWPTASGGEPDAATAREAMRLLPRMKEALFGEGDPFAIGLRREPDTRAALAIIGEAERLAGELVLGEASEQFLARRGHVGLIDWSEAHATPAAHFVRTLVARGWMDEAAVDATALGMPAEQAEVGRWLANAAAGRDLEVGILPETTPFSRRRHDPAIASLQSHGLGARYAARLAELARLPLEMRDLALGEARPGAVSASVDGHGAAIVEAARGVLAHVARVEDGVVADYRIISPTDWNFHQRGIAAQCLAALGDGSDRGDLAHLVVRAIDPCVAYEMRIQ